MVVRKTGLMDIWLTDWLTGFDWYWKRRAIGVCVYVFALVMCTCIARCLALLLFFVCLQQQQQQQLVYCSRCSCMQIGLPLCVRHMASMSATPQAAAPAPAAQAHSPNPSSDCARFCLAHLAAAAVGAAALARSGVVLP